MANREEGKTTAIKLVWRSAEDLPTVYANQLYITHAGGSEFYLVFGELGPQVNLDVENPPEHIEIKPRVKIAVSAGNIEKMVSAINENVGKFIDRAEAQEEGEQ